MPLLTNKNRFRDKNGYDWLIFVYISIPKQICVNSQAKMAPVVSSSSRISWATAALAPWCAFLKEYASVALRPRGDALLLYVRLRPASPGSLPIESIARCREALALLGAVAAVDNAAWQLLLEHECACSNLPLVDLGVLDPCFELRLGDSKDETLGFDTLFYRTFFMLDELQPVSDEFSDAMQVIIDRAIHTRAFVNMGRYMLHLRFIPRRSIEPELVSPYLQSVLEVVREIRRHEKTLVRQLSFMLAETSVRIDHLVLPDGASSILAQLVDCDDESGGVLMYPSFEIDGNATIGRLLAGELAHVLERLTSFGTGRASSESVVHNRVHITNSNEHLSKSASSKYLHTIRALCSAVMESQRVDELHLDNTVFGARATKKNECWQWLAYALFSKDATASRISKLTIEDNYFRNNDIDTILRCLRSKNPAAKLWRVGKEGQPGAKDNGDGGGDYDNIEEEEKDYQEHVHLDDHQIFGVRAINSIEEDYGELDFRDSQGEADDSDDASENGDNWEDDQGEQDPTSVCLKAGAAVEICISSRQENERVSVPPSYAGRHFRVMNNDESLNSVDIIVPCYGHCRVQRESIAQFVADPPAIAQSSSLSRGYRGSITAISFNFQRPTDGNALLPLIKYLGPQLTSLDMQSEVGVNSACFRKIMSACPSLETLAIFDMLNVVELDLMAAYEEKMCTISDLSIVEFTPSDNTTRLIRMLCDPTSEAAQNLRHLKLIPESLQAFEATTLTAVLAMLQVNNVFESLQLRLSPSLYDAFAPDLLRFHRQTLPVVKAPLPLSCRLAFLSVVRTMSYPSSSSNSSTDGQDGPLRKKPRLTTGVDLQRLDSDVISLIFHFAAERPIREIVLRSL